MFIAFFAASWSVRIRDRLGLAGALLTATALQTIIIAVMGFVLHPLVLVPVLLRSAPRVLMTAPVNAAATPITSGQSRDQGGPRRESLVIRT